MVKNKLAKGVLVTAFLFSSLWAGSLYAPTTATLSPGSTNLASGSLDTNYVVVRTYDSPTAGTIFTANPTAGTSCRTAGQSCQMASECCDDTDPCTTPVCSGAQVALASQTSTSGTCALQTEAGCGPQCKNIGTPCKQGDTCCPSDNDSCRNDVCRTISAGGNQGNFCVRERDPSCQECTSAANCDDGNRCTQDSCVNAGPYVVAPFSTCRNVQLEGCTQTPQCGDGILDPGEDCDLNDANIGEGVYLCTPEGGGNCNVAASRFTWFSQAGLFCFANPSGAPECTVQTPGTNHYSISRSSTREDGTTVTMTHQYDFLDPATMDFANFSISSPVSPSITMFIDFSDTYHPDTQTIDLCPVDIRICYRETTCDTTPVPPDPARCYHYQLKEPCNGQCHRHWCGDGTVDSGEQCDDGNGVDGDTCKNDCTTTAPAPRCGDGILTPPEQCDDGNLMGGDGCDSACLRETPPPGDPCIHFAEEGNWTAYNCCGAGYADGSAEDKCCDQGLRPATPEFGCCLDPTGPNCTPPGGECTTDADCDDKDPCTLDECGHADGVNGPIPMCTHAKISDCTPPTGACTTDADCDDKDPCTKDSCTPATAAPGSPLSCKHDPDPEHCPPTEPKCGDGIVQAPEECDGGGKNADLPNECRSNCKLPYCGDKIVDNISEEECDDGNEIGTDGCNKCTVAQCGNGRIDPGETCDPGSPIQPLAGSKEPAEVKSVEVKAVTLDKYVEGTKTEFNKLGEPMSGYVCSDDCKGYKPECGDGNLDKGEDCDPPGSIGKDGRVCTDLCTYTKPSEKCVEEKTARDSAFAKWDAGQDPEGAEFFAAAQGYCDCTGVQTLLCKHDDCPPCEGISDPALKACCERHGGLTFAATEECIPDSNNPGPACQILFPTVEVGSFTFVNNGNICCNSTNAINSNLTDSGWLQCINNQLLPPGPGQPPLPPLPPLDICTSYLAAFGEMPPACLSLCQANPEAPECKDGPIVDPAGRALGIGTCTVEALNPEDIQDGEIVGIGRGGERVPLRVCLQMPAQTGLLSGKGMTFRFLQTDGRLSLLEGTTPDAETDQPLAGPKMLASITDFDGSGPLCRNAFAPLPKSMFGQTDQTVGFRYEAADLLGTALYEATCRSQPLYEASGGAGGEGCSCNLQATRPTRGVMTGNLVLLGLGLALLALRLIVGHRQGKRFFTKL